MADEDKHPGLTVIGAVFGLFAGLAALITIGGAALLALRLRFERVPAPSVFAGEISRNAVLATGMTLLVLPLTLVAAVYLGFRGARLSNRPKPRTVATDPRKRFRQVRRWRSRVWWLMGTSTRRPLHGWSWFAWWLIGTALLVGPGLAYYHYRGGFQPITWPAWWPFIGVAVCTVTILVALRVRQRLIKDAFVTNPVFNRPKAILTMTLLWTLTALPGAFLYGSAAPFDEVKVCNHGDFIDGFLVGQSTDRIYVGEVQEYRRVVSVRLDDIDAFVTGSGPDNICDNPAILPSQTGSPAPPQP